MIRAEFLRDGALIRHYSDTGMMMLQEETGVLYEEAVDAVPCKYTYTETDQPIPDAEATEADYLMALGRFGVE